MLGYAKGTDARKYKGQGKARERQRHSINENEKTHSLTRSHEKGRKRDHTPNREKAVENVKPRKRPPSQSERLFN